MRSKQKSWKKIILTIVILILIPASFLLIQRLEGEQPEVKVSNFPEFIGKESKLELMISDQKSGVRKVWISLIQNGKEITVFKEEYKRKNIFKSGDVKTRSVEVKITPASLKVSDGKALIRIAAWDHSWRLNKTYIEKNVTIDTTPPEVDVISRSHRIYQGGTGLVIYRIPENGIKSGVVAGENFFPGHSGYFSNKKIHMAFFALSHKQGPKTKLYLKAVDPAGNVRLAGFPHLIIPRPGRRDKIRLSDNFLKWKLPQFNTDQNATLIKQFLHVNGNIRRQNGIELTSPSDKTKNDILWEGRFLRLPGSSNRAKFADHRSYYYNRRVVDHQYHLGIDLASYKNAPVPAANSGIIVLNKKIGIYGKTVIIDHGFGVFTTYSHLSSTLVEKGRKVKKGDIIGRTGITGMTGGDHLHYGMYVNKVFVNPIEWWDTNWIKNNILFKINQISSK